MPPAHAVPNHDLQDQQRSQQEERAVARRLVFQVLDEKRLAAAQEYFFQAQSLVTAYHNLLASDRAPTLLAPNLPSALDPAFTTQLRLPALPPTVAPNFLLPTRDTVLAHGRTYIAGGYAADAEATQKQADRLAHALLHDLRRARQDAGLAWPFPTPTP